MTKKRLTYFFVLTINLALGQTDPRVRQIFLNLPLDKSRIDIQNAIKSDRRFISTDTDTTDLLNEFTYIGLSKDNGVVKSKPDSVEIELTYGITANGSNTKSKAFGDKTYLKLRYFYSSRDSVDKEYHKLLNILQPNFKDAANTRIDTIYSDSPYRRKFKASGMTFKSSKPKFTIQVLNARITDTYFGLFLEYECDE
jgi:hypothetical protein